MVNQGIRSLLAARSVMLAVQYLSSFRNRRIRHFHLELALRRLSRSMSKPTIPPSRPKTRFLLVSLLSPPANGQALAFEILCRGLGVHNYDCRVVNIQGKISPP